LLYACPAPQAKFANLRLKKDALEALALPIAISEGVVESLTLSIPWTPSLLYQLYTSSFSTSASADVGATITMQASSGHILS
jgi:hypothetical protein